MVPNHNRLGARRVIDGVGISLINPITAYDHQLFRDDLVTKSFKPTFHYRFRLIYKPNWSSSRLVGLLKERMPSLPDYLLADKKNSGFESPRN